MTETFFDRYLDQMRHVGDPLADATAEAVFREHAVEGLDAMMSAIMRNDQIVPDDLPAPAREFFEVTAVLPEWADPALIETAEELFIDYGLISSTLLACASLPECYAMKNGIHVLWTTQKLEQHVYRRVLETAQMIMDVLRPGGLAPGGRGIRAAQKVRLLHASIRHLLLTEGPAAGETAPPSFSRLLHSTTWDPALGHPICQEDMAYTLQTFSYVVVRGLKQFGADLTPDQVEAYMHSWNVVGHVMGVQHDLIPETPGRRFEQGRLLYELISSRQRGATPECQAMERALLDFIEGMLPGPLKDVPSALTRYFVGPEVSEVLGIPEPSVGVELLERATIELLEGISALEKLGEKNIPAMHRVSLLLHLRLLDKIGTMPRGWDEKLFVLPKSLKEDAEL